MRRLAKILLAGTAVATLASAAEAQTRPQRELVTEQILLGDVFGGDRLHVIDPADGASAQAQASGNAANAGVEGEDLSYRTDQRVRGATVKAKTDVEVHGWTPSTTATSIASGNAGEAWASGGGEVDAKAEQLIRPGGRVKASTDVRAQLSSSGDTDASSVALGNSQAYAVDAGGYVKSDTLQRQYGNVTADTKADLLHTKGQVTLSSQAASNDVSHKGNGASGEARVRQHATGDTIAATDADVRSGYLLDAKALASANTAHALSESRELKVDARQKHEGYVRAESWIYVKDFGGISSSAQGVGNSVDAFNFGETADLDVDQSNLGAVEAVAVFLGGDGYDSNVTATAYGNMVAANTCTDCDGELVADIRQVNSAGVTADARTVITGSGRTAKTTSTATGNSAAFYVTRPRY